MSSNTFKGYFTMSVGVALYITERRAYNLEFAEDGEGSGNFYWWCRQYGKANPYLSTIDPRVLCQRIDEEEAKEDGDNEPV